VNVNVAGDTVPPAAVLFDVTVTVTFPVGIVANRTLVVACVPHDAHGSEGETWH
jgi:hypothetical protein